MLQYADDRPWPGSSGWSDAVSRSALNVIAQGVVHMTGYEVSCIRVVHQGVLRAVAMCGTDEQRNLVMDSRTPVSLLETELSRADVWGRFQFLPAERVPDVREWGAAVFEIETIDAEDAWQVEDVVAAPIRDASGAMVGLLSVDVPVTRRRADAETRERLEQYAELVEGAVLMALERDEQQERIRMSRAARQVVAAATRELSMEAIFAESADALMSGFQAMGLWLHTLDDDEGFGAMHAEAGVVVAIPPEMVAVAERVAERAWSQKLVAVLSRGESTREPAGEEMVTDREAILDYLETMGVASILFIPIGVASECLGCLALSRGPGNPRWSEVESEAARDIGMDLGRAILNARAFEREQHAVAELQALDTYKSRLVATLSHELKTPLTSILGNLELLDGLDEASNDTRRSVSAIGRGAHRLVRIVDDLMLLAKMGDRRNPLIARPVDLGVVVADVVELTAATRRQRGLTLTFIEPPEPVLVAGDADELDRLVSNLVSNALKYTPRGGHVHLDASYAEGVPGEDGAQVAVFTCTDDGIGISADDKTRLFREFFRSADPVASAEQGTGLGLAIVEQIVQRHGGRVKVVSAPHRGSTFQVFLPAASEATARSAEPRTPDHARP